MPPNISTSCGKIPTCRRTCPFVSRKRPHPARHSDFCAEIPDMPLEVRTFTQKSRTCDRTFEYLRGNSSFLAEILDMRRNVRRGRNRDRCGGVESRAQYRKW